MRLWDNKKYTILLFLFLLFTLLTNNIYASNINNPNDYHLSCKARYNSYAQLTIEHCDKITLLILAPNIGMTSDRQVYTIVTPYNDYIWLTGEKIKFEPDSTFHRKFKPIQSLDTIHEQLDFIDNKYHLIPLELDRK